MTSLTHLWPQHTAVEPNVLIVVCSTMKIKKKNNHNYLWTVLSALSFYIYFILGLALPLTMKRDDPNEMKFK